MLCSSGMLVQLWKFSDTAQCILINWLSADKTSHAHCFTISDYEQNGTNKLKVVHVMLLHDK